MNLEAYLADIGPDHPDTADAPNAPEYDRLRRLSPDELAGQTNLTRDALSRSLHLRAEGQAVELKLETQSIPAVGDTGVARVSELKFTGALPPSARQANWSVDARVGDSVIRLRKAGTTANVYSEYVQRANQARTFP